MDVLGHFSDGRQTRTEPASLTLEHGRLSVCTADGVLRAAAPLAQVDISARLGRIPRQLVFPCGGCFTTEDNDGVDALSGARRSGQGLVDRLESHWRAVLVAILIAVVAVIGGVAWGIPAAARHAAFELPDTVGAETERIALELLERDALAPSTLDAAEQQRLQQAFRPLLAQHRNGPAIRVLFRDARDSFGANALALPGGTIVMTDQLVALAQHDEELLAILAHEIGHIAERHALRHTVQVSALSLMTLLVFGDVSSVPALAASVPVVLTEMGYSRDFEREADRFAARALHAQGIKPRRLADILIRLDPAQTGSSYLSTHPPTPERVELIRQHGTR